MSFISFNNVTIRVRNKFLLAGISLDFKKSDNLLVVGANGSGKTTLVKAIAGLLPVSQGEIVLDFLNDPLPYPSVHKNKIAYVSFEGHKKIHSDNELKKDIEDFTGVAQKTFNLSTGQTRKYLIDKALEKNPAILILDEPFDGLDIESRKDLKKIVEGLSKKIFLILVTHRADEIVKGIKRALLINEGEVEGFGNVDEILGRYKLFNTEERGTVVKQKGLIHPEVLMDFQNVSVTFHNKRILDGINWKVRKGENWAILGPNGAGKSTLVKLITGENLQVFANNIKLFGKLRSEIGVEVLMKKIAVVSADLSLRIHDYLPVSKVIGVENFQVVQKLGLGDLINKKYGELSFGQKRMVLIAKSLNKNPEILILDEPCHGLDAKNRKLVLDEIEKISHNGTSVILITHHQDEIIPSINKVMYLRNGKIEKISDLG